MTRARILIVEDEMVVSMELYERLKALGYEPTGRAITGEQALAMAENNRPDLILMDIRLIGEMDGIDTAIETRRRFQIPVIFITAYSEDETLERAKLAEPYGYILKPFEDRDLKSSIELALHKHRADQEVRRLSRLYDVLSQVNQTIARVKSLEELFPAICRLSVERGEIDMAWIGRLDPVGSRMEPVARYGEGCDLLDGAQFHADSRPEGRDYPGGPVPAPLPFVCNDQGAIKRLYPEFGFRSRGSFPLTFQGGIWGSLNICMFEPDFFRDREIDLFREVALYISFALDKIDGDARRERAEATVRTQNAVLSGINRVFREALGSHSEQELGRICLSVAEEVTGSKFGFLAKISAKGRLEDIAVSDPGWDACRVADPVGHGRFPADLGVHGIYGRVVKDEKGFFTNDPATHPDRLGFPEGHPPLEAFLGVPLRRDARTVGMVGLGNREGGYRHEDLEAMEALAPAMVEAFSRKRAEIDLRQSEELFSTIVGQAMEAIVVVDTEGRFVEFNTAAHEGLGYTREEFIHMAVSDIQAEHTPEIIRRNLEQTHEQGGLVFETKHRRHGGEIRDVRVSLTPLGIRDNQFFAIVWTDLTERKQMEEALRRSEERHRNIVQAAMDGYVLMDMEGRLIEVNESYCRMSGYSAEELLGMRASQLEADHSAEEIAAHSRWMMEQGQTRFETRHRRKDGAVYDIEISIQHRPAEGGQLVCFLRDISERKQAEKAVQRLTAAIEQAAEVIVITDPEGNIEYVNPAFERLTGYGRDEALGQNPRILKSGQQDDTFYMELWRTISSGSTWRGRLVNKRNDGTVFTEDATISPVRDEAGRIVNYVAAKRDISEEVRLQGQLFHAQKMESVGRLAGGVAHDFNNMLGVILGHTELALECAKPEDSIRAALQEIHKATIRSADLTRQLLAFARKQTISPKVIALNDCISGVLTMLKRLIGENVELGWFPGRDLLPVKIDPSQVDQLLANLAVNARDAISEVGKITIATENISLTDLPIANREGVAPGDYVLLTVSDNGAGMSQEVIDHIFEPFFTTKDVGRGTGLGLSTVYGIVKQNSGFLNVDSEPGRGATFKIYLPCAPMQVPGVSQAGSAKKVLTGTETVLLVEDERAILALGKAILERQGYTVLAARGPAEALSMAQSHKDPVHLLITDVIMPEMNGRELRDRLQAVKQGFKCIFMSGYTADVIAHHGVLDQGIDFLQKPFSVKALAQKVRDVLDS